MRIGRFAFGECSSLTLPPEVDDAISPRSPLRPPRKSFAFALRTAVSSPGRCIGTRKCRNVKPLRFRDTALAVLIRYLLRLRFCTPLPLCYTLFQRLALLSDTSLVQSAYKAETSRYVLHCEQDSYCHRLLSLLAVHSHYSPYGKADLSPMEHVGLHSSLRPPLRTTARQYEQ